jgi:sugar phosphate isomerase/epimerase
MQLGLSVELRPEDQPGPLAEQVAELGYHALHVHFPAGCDAAMARRISRACAESGLSIAAVSGYANPLRPSEAPMGSSFEQLADLIELLPRLDARRIISWSGNCAPELFDDHPDTHTDAARELLHDRIDELLPLLDESEAILLLAPHYRHVLGQPALIAEFCAELNSPYLRVVLDLASLLPPEAWGRQAELIPAAVASLTPYVGMIQLRDVRLRDGQPELCGPGQGKLDYRRLLRALRDAELTVPTVIAQVDLPHAAAARRYVFDRWRG